MNNILNSHKEKHTKFLFDFHKLLVKSEIWHNQIYLTINCH